MAHCSGVHAAAVKALPATDNSRSSCASETALPAEAREAKSSSVSSCVGAGSGAAASSCSKRLLYRRSYLSLSLDCACQAVAVSWRQGTAGV